MIHEVNVFNAGKITLEDVWGDEGRIIDTARISASNKIVEGKELTEKDIGLLEDLWKGGHGTPFETMYFRFRMNIPIFVARQFVKHRISSWNEMSKRYRGGVSEYYVPDNEAVTVDGIQIFKNEDLDDYIGAIEEINKIRRDGLERSYARIEQARSEGIIPPDTKDGRDPYRARARELWRGLETVAEHTEIIWTINFRSLSNFFNLRLDEHAQYEAQQCAQAMFECFTKAYPLMASVYKGE